MKKTAIIDIGSNSVRLVIYKGLKEIDNIKVFAQLRRHLDSNGNISPEGIENLLETLQGFSRMIAYYDVRNTICAATATVRQAKNKKEIIKLAKMVTGLEIRIISEYEEAFFGCQAILNSSPLQNGYTIDLGGGSTEVTLVIDRKMVHYHSFPFGAVSLKQQFVKGMIPTVEECQQISGFIRQQLESLPWIEENNYPIYAIGGSARNLARAHQGMIGYPLLGEHLYQMKLADLECLQERFTSGSIEDLTAIDAINKDRMDTIIPALQTFVELSRILGSEAFFLSRKGFRDGLVAADPKVFTIKTIRKVAIEALSSPTPLYDKALELASLLKLKHSDYEFLEYGMTLYNIGRRFSANDSRSHSFYFIANIPMNGFTHKERIALALLASYHSRGRFKKDIAPYESWFTKEEKQKLQLLGSLIKFVDAMGLQGKPVVNLIKMASNSTETMWLQLTLAADFPHKKEELLKQKKHLERVLKKDIHLEFLTQ
ncbi:MAG: Ppx/GppA family phosphatase [Turicibacter sp.]|nr:Ppx/GppA family phosphatase [Turicibacter sp.]